MVFKIRKALNFSQPVVTGVWNVQVFHPAANGNYCFPACTANNGTLTYGKTKVTRGGNNRLGSLTMDGWVDHGDPPGGGTVEVYGCARDGSLVVGNGPTVAYPNWQWYSWSPSTGYNLAPIPTLASPYSYPGVLKDVAGNGVAIVGAGYHDTYPTLFDLMGVIWTAAKGSKPLPPPAGYAFTQAEAVSDDGLVVVGESFTSDFSFYTGTRWTSADGGDSWTATDIGRLPVGHVCFSTDCSSDGSVVVGYASIDFPTVNYHPWRWTAATGMVDLGVLAGGYTFGYARAVSADGNTVVGPMAFPGGVNPMTYYWTPGGGMVALPQYPGSNLPDANAISADGRIIWGDCNFNTPELPDYIQSQYGVRWYLT